MSEGPAVPPIEIAPPPDDEGIIARALRKVLGRSWKTSVLGFCALLSGVIPLVPNVDPKWAQVVLAVLTGAGLMFSKDGDVSGPKPPGSAS